MHRTNLSARRLLLVAAALAVVGGCGSAAPTVTGETASPSAITGSLPSSTPAGSSTAPTASSVAPAVSAPSASNPSGLPAFRHVYVIIMENKEYSSIVGRSSAPYLNSLIARYGSATNLYAETHPSEPNYIALTSGGLQGTDSDAAYRLRVPNLFDQIETSGRKWHVFAQGYPGGCFTGAIAGAVKDGDGAAGEYVRKHNPAISYTSISESPARCANITNLASFDPAAADFEMIVPNQINDMHSSSVEAGDAFLKTFVPRITGSAEFADSVLFITWDEGGTSAHGGGHIATLIVSPGIRPGTRFDAPATHYSILRTIELAWGMPLLGEAAQASTIDLEY